MQTVKQKRAQIFNCALRNVMGAQGTVSARMFYNLKWPEKLPLNISTNLQNQINVVQTELQLLEGMIRKLHKQVMEAEEPQ